MPMRSPSSTNLVLGCHLSIARGLAAAIDEAERLGSNALQIFTHTPVRWSMPPIPPETATLFRARLRRSSLRFVAVHAMYLLNLASPERALHSRSVKALGQELERAGALGIQQVILHPGASRSGTAADGIRRVADGIGRAFEHLNGRFGDVALLLENTAGAGTGLGASWESLHEIIERSSCPERLGVCLDTCHAFAAGIALGSKDDVQATVEDLDRSVGLDRLKMIHLNDCATGLGSRVDRHAHLGRGQIGEAGLHAVVNHPYLGTLPFVLETPKQLDGRSGADAINLRWVRDARRREGAL